MNLKDPKLIALQFNECINNQDIEGLVRLMTDDHIFIDRAGDQFSDMVSGWKEFFSNFPTYKNYFTRVDSHLCNTCCFHHSINRGLIPSCNQINTLFFAESFLTRGLSPLFLR